MVFFFSVLVSSLYRYIYICLHLCFDVQKYQMTIGWRNVAYHAWLIFFFYFITPMILSSMTFPSRCMISNYEFTLFLNHLKRNIFEHWRISFVRQFLWITVCIYDCWTIHSIFWLKNGQRNGDYKIIIKNQWNVPACKGIWRMLADTSQVIGV